MSKVIIYTTRFCPYCVRGKHLLEQKGAKYKGFRVDNDPKLRQIMAKKSNRRTVPQIWINDKHVGGCDELYALERSDKLDKLLNI